MIAKMAVYNKKWVVVKFTFCNYLYNKKRMESKKWENTKDFTAQV